MRLTDWYGDVKPMRELTTVCCMGTTKREFQLLRDMRTPLNDDIWALCRLIMFGNVQVFADAHVGDINMRLSMSPLAFVFETSTALCDPSVWAAFVAIVPNAEPPLPKPDEPVLWEAPETVPYIQPLV
jgi:hypothetical protein